MGNVPGDASDPITMTRVAFGAVSAGPERVAALGRLQRCPQRVPISTTSCPSTPVATAASSASSSAAGGSISAVAPNAVTSVAAITPRTAMRPRTRTRRRTRSSSRTSPARTGCTAIPTTSCSRSRASGRARHTPDGAPPPGLPAGSSTGDAASGKRARSLPSSAVGLKNRPISGSSKNDSARATAIDALRMCSGES